MLFSDDRQNSAYSACLLSRATLQNPRNIFVNVLNLINGYSEKFLFLIAFWYVSFVFLWFLSFLLSFPIDYRYGFSWLLLVLDTIEAYEKLYNYNEAIMEWSSHGSTFVWILSSGITLKTSALPYLSFGNLTWLCMVSGNYCYTRPKIIGIHN